jgi:hypothetical protein
MLASSWIAVVVDLGQAMATGCRGGPEKATLPRSIPCHPFTAVQLAQGFDTAVLRRNISSRSNSAQQAAGAACSAVLRNSPTLAAAQSRPGLDALKLRHLGRFESR